MEVLISGDKYIQVIQSDGTPLTDSQRNPWREQAPLSLFRNNLLQSKSVHFVCMKN